MASSKITKMPPCLTDDTDYQNWKSDVKVWSLFTDITKTKMGPAIYLSLEGKSRDVVRDIDTTKLSLETGYEEILKKLDEVFEKDKNTRSYLAFKALYEFKRSAGMQIIEFVTLFEKLHGDMKRYDMTLPEPVQAFMLLNAANISVENEKLARATIDVINYENMKKKILNIFAENSNESAPEVKVETDDVLYTRQGNSWSSQRSRSNGTYRSGRGGRSGGRANSSRGLRGGQRSQDERSDSNSSSGFKCYICQSTEHFAYRCPENQNRSKCYICQSVEHLANRCPNRTQRERTDQQVNITLISSEECSDLTDLVGDTLGMALLDSGCTKTVVGEKWLEVYSEMLNEEGREMIIYTNDYSTFRFGDGAQVISKKKVTMPAVIGNRKIKIDANVVTNNIPLLLSRDSMKKGDTIIDFGRDTVIMLGQEMQLYRTRGGHYCLPLSPMVNSMKSMGNVVLTITTEFKKMSMKEKKVKAVKLHQQFAHPRKEKLIKLLKDSKNLKEDKDLFNLIEEVSDECIVCEEMKKPKSRPVVGMPIAREFNEVVCMDLKEYIHNKTWILHLIDAFSRKSAAVLINTKKDTEIIKKIYSEWIRHYGAPKKFLADNGGEFANEKFKEMNEKMNIVTCHTAAESPFSNGIVERHNQILFECFQKVLKDTNCDPEIGLGWSVSAKNSLGNNDGFSSDQLVFGRNPNYPSVVYDEPPALESSTNVDIIRENMNAMHKARSAFIECESSERIRRALRHNIRTYSNVVYKNGDKVYYTRKNYKGWKGPATVLGQDGQCIMVKHGSVYCRVHPCHLLKKIHQENEKSTDENNSPALSEKESKSYASTIETTEKLKKKSLQMDDVSIHEDEEETGISVERANQTDVSIHEDEEETGNANSVNELSGGGFGTEIVEDNQEEEYGVDTYDEDMDTEIDVDIVTTNNTEFDKIHELQQDSERHISVERANQTDVSSDSSIETDEESETEKSSNTENSPEKTEIENGSRLLSEMNMSDVSKCEDGEIMSGLDSEWPKNKSSIQFLENEIWKEALVLSIQPKRSGKHKDWLNIHVRGEKEPRSIVWEEVVAWKKIPDTERVLLLSEDQHLDQEILDAKYRELDNLRLYNVYEECSIEEVGCNRIISTRWVISEKHCDGKKIVKARLVARGFEEDSTDLIKDSPTCTKESLRLVLTVAASKQWPIQSLDISSAFLQGNELQRKVYVMPPADIRTEGVVWKLKQCIYGLNDAPRAWYNKVKNEMKTSGATVSKYDNALFMWHKGGELVGILVTHVDDFIFGGTRDWNTRVIGDIRNKFKISSSHTSSFKYIGLAIQQYEDEIEINQEKYVSEIKEIPVEFNRKKDPNQIITMEERKQLKVLSGQMLWVTNHTRPDLSYETCVMSNAGKNPTVRKLLEANKAVRKLKKDNLSIKFCALESLDEINIVAHSDATYASLEDGSSQGAYIVGIQGKLGLIPISWQSRKLRRVTQSPLASEALAQCEGADAAYLICNLLKEIFPKSRVSTPVCKTDSDSLIQTLKTTKVHDDKRLRVDVSRLKEMVTEGEIIMEWVSSKDQLADALTKRGVSTDSLVAALRM